MYDLYTRSTKMSLRERSSYLAVVTELVLISEGKVYLKFHNKDDPTQTRTEIHDYSEITGSYGLESRDDYKEVYRNRAASYLAALSWIYWNDNLPFPGGEFTFEIRSYKNVNRSESATYVAEHRYEYPLFAIWPEGKPKKLSELSTPDAVIYPTAQMYTDLDEDQTEKKREYIIHKTDHEVNHARTIIDYGDDPNVVEACRLWLAYLYNRAFHIWDDANINNDAFWREFLEIQTLDAFLLDYDYSTVTDAATQSMKQNMYDGFIVYDYADGVFSVKRSSTVTPDPADSVMAYGSKANHRWVRQRLGLEPLKSLRDATLRTLAIGLEGTAEALPMMPAFTPDRVGYVLEVSELQTYEVAAIPNHSLATVEKTEDMGDSGRTYFIKVTSEDGEVEKTYSILVVVVNE